MRKLLLGSTLVMALLFGVFAQAQMGQMGGGNERVGKRHPNLMAAQHHIEQALDKIKEAQQANEFDLGGHAAKAKELLDQSYREIKQAAEFANQDRKAKPE